MALSLCLTGCSGGGDDDGDTAPDARASSSAGPPEPTFGEQAVRRLTLREQAGQVIVASWAGTGSPAPLVRRLHLGGVIAFSGNVESTDQIRRVNGDVRRVVARRGWPAFVGVDQEGGLVDRVGAPSTGFPAFMAAGAADDPGLTERAARASAAEMRGLGFDVVFAPVADVTVGDGDAAIGSRSAGGDPQQVARQVVAASEGIAAAGVLPVVKHFPGHGSLGADSHAELPVQRRGLRSIERRDLVPFEAAVAAGRDGPVGAPAVLTGHIAVRAVDRGVPASISRKVTTGLLRRDLGFQGLVVTDALDMQGVQRLAPGPRAAVRALRAGADVLLMPPDPRAARDAIVRAVRQGDLSRARLAEAAARMVDTMHGLGRGTAAAPGSGGRAADALARRSVTSVAGPCEGRLVGDRVRVVGAPDDVAAFDSLVQARGVTVARDYTKRVRAGSRSVVVGSRTVVTKVRKKVEVKGKVRVKVVKVRTEVPVRERRPVYKQVLVVADAPTVALVGSGGGTPGAADVTVALDRPGVLGRVSSRVELAAYSDQPASLRAVVDVLLGERDAPGRLPLEVAGAERRGC
ncbi:glycoside hydrolase family 3 protein [Nocardioides aurantiacus]|uniref:beta-N-acetylhexosaminidase n=1 Tax=Nocardioides aurantiacus TaxID=86796 RepID=A0A3N2CQV2_9ACTN|nr:glycoside hydrolase family 3 N-terminal domain-containing protein [Nocardioides aurantiacus]ROR89704.1 beta-N-acetylhexosaminidase [Nocardioides aurantiacus]